MSSDKSSSLADLVGDVVNKQTVVAGVIAGVVATGVAGGFSLESLGSNLVLYGGSTVLADAGAQLILGSKVGKELSHPVEAAVRVAAVGAGGVALLSLAGITTLDLSSANLMAGLIMGGSAEASCYLMQAM